METNHAERHARTLQRNAVGNLQLHYRTSSPVRRRWLFERKLDQNGMPKRRAAPATKRACSGHRCVVCLVGRAAAKPEERARCDGDALHRRDAEVVARAVHRPVTTLSPPLIHLVFGSLDAVHPTSALLSQSHATYAIVC